MALWEVSRASGDPYKRWIEAVQVRRMGAVGGILEGEHGADRQRLAVLIAALPW
jgi:hypothetical protein